MPYSEKLIEQYEHPKNVGTLDKNDESVGTGMVGAPACGDVMRLQIKVNDEGIIEDAKFKTYGCASAIASSSLVSEWVKGKSLRKPVRFPTRKLPKNLRYRPSRFTARFWPKTPSRQQSTTTKPNAPPRIRKHDYVNSGCRSPRAGVSCQTR